MASTLLQDAKRYMTNYARLGHAAQELLPDILRELVLLKEPINKLRTDFLNHQYLNSKYGLKPIEWMSINNVAINEYSDFDIPLLYKLIRNLKLVPPPTSNWENPFDPKPNEVTMGDDVERIRRKRNEIIHRGNANVSNEDLAEYFSMFKAIAQRFEIYMGKSKGHFVSRFENLEICCMDVEVEERFLEKMKEYAEKEKEIIEEVKQVRTDVQLLKMTGQTSETQKEHLNLHSDEIEKLKAMMNVIVERISVLSDPQRKIKNDLFKSYISDWERDEEYFIATRAAKSVFRDILSKNTIVITGCPGSGKSAIVHHIALYLHTMHEYEIIPSVVEPSEVTEYLSEKKKQIFVIDDVFGKITVNSSVVEKWISHSERIAKILSLGNVKLLMTCRLQIIKDPLLRLLKTFICNQYDLQQNNLCLLKEERVLIAEKYLSKDVIENISEFVEVFDFFPLLCKLFPRNANIDSKTFFRNPIEVIKQNIIEMKQANKTLYCAFTLCVLYNETLREEWFDKGHEKEGCIRSACEEIGIDLNISRRSLKEQLKNLENTHVRKLNRCYRLIHDAVFDVAATVCGQDLLQCFIDDADVTFIGDRYQMESLNADLDEYVIRIAKSSEHVYFKRLLTDLINGNTYSTFQNRQLQFDNYRRKLISFLSANKCVAAQILLKFDELQYKNIEWKKRLHELDLYRSDDDADDDAFGSIYTPDHQENFIDICLPILEASAQGYTDIVHLLLSMGCNVNIYDNYGRTALYVAALHGHVATVRFILRNGAIASLCDKWERSPFYIACGEGYAEIVRLLLNKSSISKCDTCFFKTPLHVSCERGHTSIVRILLESGTDVTQTNSDGHSPLYVACDHGHTLLVELLIAIGCDVNQFDEKDRTPLFVACKNGHADIVKLLLGAKADVSKCDTDGFSPLHVSCKWGHIAAVQLLLKANVNHDKSDRYYGRTPLFLAFEGKHEDIIELLIQNGSNIYHCNSRKQSLLYIACKNELESVVQRLLQLMSDQYVLSFNYSDWSPLIAACEAGNTSIVNMLLERNIYVNIRNEDGHCPLHIACEQGKTDMVQVLLSYGCEINQVDGQTKQSALFIACEEGFFAIVDLLLDNGAKADLFDEMGWSPFFVACCEGHADIVELLIQRQAETLDFDEKEMRSPLFIACMGGHTETAQILLQHGADVNHVDNKMWTPLHIALKEGFEDVVKLLLEHGADSKMCTNGGKSPIQLAHSSFRSNVVALLENVGD